jgi:uncharacterized protein
MSNSIDRRDPYSTSLQPFAVDAELNNRLAFLRRVYMHVFAGILILVGLECLYMMTPLGEQIFQLFGSAGLLALIGFIAVCWYAQKLAFSGASQAKQYLGLGLYIGVESIFVAPAVYFALMTNPDLIGQAAFLTVLITGSLTLFVVLSNKDFSFLRNALFLAGIGIVALAFCSMFFGFSLGIGLSVAVIVLMCGYILYETSLIMKHLPTTAHVAGALMIFASITQLFRHLIFLLSYLSND